ncbi:hypothetical protein IAT38_000385 [Cryptococcus sp. DSM 104549]
MSHNTHTNYSSIPPPPYPGTTGSALAPSPAPATNTAAQYDLTPTPYIVNRPRLPEDNRNAHLSDLPEDINIVKFQTIVREGKEIVVGRIKVPIAGPTPHAFILRRYDTDAISLTTMYKVAFPGASEDDEKREMDWVKSSFDTRGTNGGRGSDVVRLAGQWVSRHLAIHLADAYHLTPLIAALARAVPDPNVAYRKSQRSQQAADELARQRASPSSPGSAATGQASAVPEVTADNAAAPAAKRQRRQSTPGSATSAPEQSQSQASADQDTRHFTIEATTTVQAPAGQVDMEAEIAEAKRLVTEMKNKFKLRAEAGDQLEEQGVDVAEESRGTKRGKNTDEGVAISGGASGKDRLIRVNKRVVQNAATDVGKFGWGALIFSVGLGATITLCSQYASAFL